MLSFVSRADRRQIARCCQRIRMLDSPLIARRDETEMRIKC